MAQRRRVLVVMLAILAAASLQVTMGHAATVPTYLDPTFGSNGVATPDATESLATAVAIQPDGRILVGGARGQRPTMDGAVSRLLMDGRLDTSFAEGGTFVLDDHGLQSQVSEIVVQPDGRLLLAVYVYSAAAGREHVDLLRLDSTGHVDVGFGQGGTVTGTDGISVFASSAGLALQSDGKVLLAGAAEKGPPHEFDMSVARFEADGTVDSTFGSGGIATADFSTPTEARDDFATAVAVLPGGRIVIGGPSTVDSLPSGFALAGFTPQGAPDAGFGAGGRVVTVIPSTNEHPWGRLTRLLAQPDGKVAAIGTVRVTPGASGAEFVFARYTPAGALDPTFGSGGLSMVDVQSLGGETPAVASSLALDANGRLVAAGARQRPTLPSEAYDIVVVRLLPSGVPDASFGGNGSIVTRLPEANTRAHAVAVQPDGRVVVAGQIDFRSAVLRYRAGSGVTAWGWNPAGELATGTNVDAHAPAAAPALFGTDTVSVGAYHGLAAKGDGSVSSWGWNGAGQLGDGTTSDRWWPVTVPGLSGMTAVAAGGYHSIAVKGDDGTVWSWGWNVLGQLGDGTTTDRYSPAAVPGLSNIAGVSAGAFHSLAVKADGTVWAWGWNGVGQLGDGTTTDRWAPVPVPGLNNVVAVAAGYYHSLAVKADGTVWAWGWNGIGQLGDGTTTDRHAPMQVRGVTGVTAASGGAYHSLAVKADGTVWAWGWNVLGQLGDGTTTDRHAPVQANLLSGVASVSAGGFHSAASRTDGTTWTWGWNGVGQLGTGSTLDSHVPVAVAGLAGATSVAAGLASTFTVGP